MAETIVTLLIGKLDVMLSSEVNLIRGVDSEICLLKNKLQWLQAFLGDADAKRRGNNLIKVWVDQIRDVAYDIEDAVDEYSYKIQQTGRRQVGFMRSMHNCVSCTRQLNFLHEMGNRIEDFKRRLEEISKDKSQFGFEIVQVKGDGSSSSSLSQENNRLPPIVEEINVVGFEQDIKTLKQKLLGEDMRRVVITIVGMGGLGKTTLARKVYKNSDVKRHFHCQVWIYVSQKYRPRELLQGMLDCTIKPGKNETTEMTEHDMMNMIKGYLRDKRYLLVIDDIWDGAAWDSICGGLPDEMNGSRIILTTRIRDVGVYVEPEGFVYELQCLNEKESWELFCLKAFRTKAIDGYPSKLESIGREMVKKCGGLPLAIVVLGGLLSRKPKSEIEWRRVLKAIKHELHEKEEGQSIKNILALSYADLPHYLKSCFLYFGLFPEDSEIDGERLVHMWVAEGFVQTKGNLTLEEVAEDYLMELINRCMVQEVSRNIQGRVDKCRIHDLLDLAISEGKEDKFLEVFSGNEANAQSSGSRRLAIHDGTTGEYVSSYRPLSTKLRSLSLVNGSVEQSFIDDLINTSKLLRVIDIKSTQIRRCPKQIGEMVHLRYLCLENTRIRKLPSSIEKLCNLQTLRVDKDCLVPKSVWKIETLRHVIGEVNSPTTYCNCKSSLQTLWGARGDGRWVGRILGNLTNLRRLKIKGILVSKVATLSTSLAKLINLNSLHLVMACETNIAVKVLQVLSNHTDLYDLRLCCLVSSSHKLKRFLLKEEPSPLCENLKLPPSLTKLCFTDTHLLHQDHLALLEGLPHLKILHLNCQAYVGKQMVFSTGGFPQLQNLRLSWLEELEQWIIEDGAMVHLNCLTMTQCYRLKMLPEGLQYVTTLQELKLLWMPQQLINKMNGEDWYKVQHIPTIQIIPTVRFVSPKRSKFWG